MNIEKISKLSNASILVYGDFMIDKYILGDVTRISPEAPVPILEVKSKESKLGGAGNVINNIIALGAKASVIGCVGEDPDGDWIINQLSSSGVDIEFLLKNEKVKSISKTRLASKNQQFLRYDEEIIKDIPSEIEDYIISNLDQIITDKNAIILSDYGKGAITKRVAQALIKKARNRNIPVIVDPKGKDYRKYENATICTPNLKELKLATGLNVNTESEINNAGQILLDQVKLDHLLITRSEKGISLLSANQGVKKDYPAISKDVVDVTGAGDTVVSTIALLISSGFDIETCCILANQAASIVCSKFGAATVSLNELISSLAIKDDYKLIDVTTAKYVVSNFKERNKKVVFTNGCFDLLHAGHLSSFKQAREFGDVLIVAVNGDASVRKIKGDSRPIIDENNRIKMLCSLEYVDYVILMDDDNPCNLIREIKPSVTVKGKDWENKYLPEREIVESYGGVVKFIDLAGGLSTTNIISKIKGE